MEKSMYRKKGIIIEKKQARSQALASRCFQIATIFFEVSLQKWPQHRDTQTFNFFTQYFLPQAFIKRLSEGNLMLEVVVDD